MRDITFIFDRVGIKTHVTSKTLAVGDTVEFKNTSGHRRILIITTIKAQCDADAI